MHRTAQLPLLLIAGGLALIGCTPEAAPTTIPTPTETAAFATLEEAQAAAEAAYGNYLETAMTIGRERGLAPERLQPLVTPAMYDQELPGFEELQSTGESIQGQASFVLALREHSVSRMSAYVCDNLSATDVVDTNGQSLVSPDRIPFIPYEVEFDVTNSDVLVASKAVWAAGNICEK